MRRLFLSEEVTYTGAELRSHWILERTGAPGDAIVAFLGPCEVRGERLVDLEDARAEATIFSPRMLHFLVEHFEPDLEKALLRQRLLVGLAGEAVNRALGKLAIVRRGDDLFAGERKLSVSVATRSPLSTLIHLGMNVLTEGAPVPAIGLEELGVQARPLGEEILERYCEEWEGLALAKAKVRAVP
jgi:hypothetical protein